MIMRTWGGDARMRHIDIHAHWYPEEWVALLEKEAPAIGARVARNEHGHLTLAVPEYRATFQRSYIDLDTRLKAMDETRVDVHALSLTQPMVYWAPAEFGAKLARAYNDGLAAAHLAHPQRFLGLAALPMQAPQIAVEEARRAATLPGIRGVYLATHVMGKNLDEPEFRPVFAACEALGLPVFLHPVNPLGAERMRKYHLRNFIGNTTDTAVAAASLNFGGVLDAFPRLDVVLPHAGGVLPALIGRMDHGATVRPELAHMKCPPSSYLRRFHYDTVSHDDTALVHLIERVGADRIVMGSDCPADMSYTRPVDVVERLAPLSPDERDAVLGGNAKRLLKL
jgi:aminocarboxymuconate-semialdehyde decarboxylase